MSQIVKRLRQKQQRQQWRKRIEREKIAQRYESTPIFPEREQLGYKP